MTLIQRYSNETEAFMARNLLESNGIPAQVQSDALSLLFPAPGAGTGSISLYVPDQDAERAAQLIART